MLYHVIKLLISAVLIVLISEIGKRNSLFAAALASIPLISLLGMIWLYVDTRDSLKVAALAQDILWLVIPSLTLFIVLPPMLRAGWNFWLSLGLATMLTICAYVVTLWALRAWSN